MKYLDFQLGDFITHNHPAENFSLKKGIVVESKGDYFVVHWFSYNKEFWLGAAGEEFEKLNTKYLLGMMSYKRSDKVNLSTLSRAP